MWRNLQRWRGVILVAAPLAATVWLAARNELVLYIHPRYIVFTVILAGLALVLLIAGVLAKPKHEHEHDEEEPKPGRLSRGMSVAGLVVASALAIGMIAMPATTLTSATADQREINSSSIGADAQNASAVAAAPAGNFAKFTVVDWASLLRQTSDLSFYAGKPVDVVGFVTADKSDPDNVFYVSRFVITCCAVDAQPAGVPVYYPNWSATFKIDDWVEATGEFTANRSSTSTLPVALDPTLVKAVSQPSDPYLY